MELEQQEKELTKSLSIVLQEIEEKLGQFERGKIVTTDLCGEELEYDRPSHKHTNISEQLGAHATRFIQAVSIYCKNRQKRHNNCFIRFPYLSFSLVHATPVVSPCC